jgi:hypothetical protein
MNAKRSNMGQAKCNSVAFIRGWQQGVQIRGGQDMKGGRREKLLLSETQPTNEGRQVP